MGRVPGGRGAERGGLDMALPVAVARPSAAPEAQDQQAAVDLQGVVDQGSAFVGDLVLVTVAWQHSRQGQRQGGEKFCRVGYVSPPDLHIMTDCMVPNTRLWGLVSWMARLASNKTFGLSSPLTS